MTGGKEGREGPRLKETCCEIFTAPWTPILNPRVQSRYLAATRTAKATTSKKMLQIMHSDWTCLKAFPVSFPQTTSEDRGFYCFCFLFLFCGGWGGGGVRYYSRVSLLVCNNNIATEMISFPAYNSWVLFLNTWVKIRVFILAEGRLIKVVVPFSARFSPWFMSLTKINLLVMCTLTTEKKTKKQTNKKQTLTMQGCDSLNQLTKMSLP